MDPNIKKEIVCDKAPEAIGPYSQAVIANGMLFVSGQIPIDPSTGVICGTTIEEQTALVLKNIQALLGSTGLSLEHIVKVEIFLNDINDFSGMNRVYSEMFGQGVRPARSVVEVSAIPKDAKIEISCIAAVE